MCSCAAALQQSGDQFLGACVLFSSAQLLFTTFFHHCRTTSSRVRHLHSALSLLTASTLQGRSRDNTMVKQMPLRWEARHRSKAPDPLYVTVRPPEFIHKSRVDQVLDDAHQRALDSAVMSIVSTPIAEETFAQIVDGLPLRSMALGTQNHRVVRGDPIDNHPEMCPGALEKAREFQKRLYTRGLEVASAVSTEGLRIKNATDTTSG